MMKQTEQSLVERLRKYGTGSPDALLLMHEAADALERQLAAPLSAELETIHKFLLGEGPLDGFHFGDSDTARPRKHYWWREYLRKAIAAQRAAPHADHIGEVNKMVQQLSGNSGELTAAPHAQSGKDAQPVNCREAGPGKGLCFECANGNYERCLYVAAAAPQEAPQPCRYPLCQPEAEQERIAAEVHSALYSGDAPQSHSKCATCNGTGVCDDSNFGDIWFNTWPCPACQPTAGDKK